MHALEGSFKVFLEVSKRPFESCRPGDQHIIMILERPVRCEKRDQSAQAAANAVSGHGAADGLGHGESKPRCVDETGGSSSRLRFKHKRGRGTARAAPETQKIRPFLESDQRHGRGPANWVRSIPREAAATSAGAGYSRRRTCRPVQRRPLCRKALAALRAAAGNNLGAAGRQHPLAKAVAALANKLAGLIGTFHGQSLRCRLAIIGRADAPSFGRHCRSCRIERRLYEASGVQVNSGGEIGQLQAPKA